VTVRELLAGLARDGLVDPALVAPQSPEADAARRVLVRFSRDALRVQQAGASLSVWLGALLLALFLVEGGVLESPAFAFLLGGGLLAGAAVLARQRADLLNLQLLWVAAISGQSLLLFTVSELIRDDGTVALFSVALQVVTLLAIPNLALGLLAVSVGLGSALVVIEELRLGDYTHELFALALGTCTAVLWARESTLAVRLGRLWQPLAYALPLGFLGPLLAALTDDHALPVQVALTAGWALLSIWLIGQAAREQPELRGRPQWLAWAAIVLGAGAGHRAPGIAAGIMLLVLSHLRRNPALQALALSTIGGFLFFWYYQLETSLLTKSLAAVGNGLVFLLAAGLLRRAAGRRREGEARPLAARIGAMRWLALALGLAVAIPGYVVFTKEQVLAHGETVLLRLRPVDPRSLMQGDYMRLRYAVVDKIPSPSRLESTGALIVVRDRDGVAEFVRVDDGEPLAAGELRLRYFKRGDDISLGAETFLFPEGQAAALERAAYGELALGDAGDSVLIGLRDGERRPLGPRLHDRPR
jgi:uncharacterized membrane-anchored protein